LQYSYPYSFFNHKLIYNLKTPFKLDSILLKKVYFRKKKLTLISLGKIFFYRTCNNMFVTIVTYKKGNVIASFSSKMFKSVEGRRQSFALILFKKLGFIVGVKSILKGVFDVVFVINRRMRKRKFRPLLKGLKKSGLFFRAIFILSRLSHSYPMRGKSVRRV